MPSHACCDRQLPNIISHLTAYQLPEPIHLRIVALHIKEFDIGKGKNFSQALLKLRTFKNATVSILVDKKWILEMQKENDGDNPPFIQKLEDMGVKIQSVRDLHAKIISLSAGKNKALLIGSANFTPTAMTKQHEADVYFNNDNLLVIEEINNYITQLFKIANPI